MKLYFKAVTKEGKPLEGVIEAKDTTEAAVYLRHKELTPLKIAAKGKGSFGLFSFFSRIRSQDTVLFTRQLSSMLASGLTLIRSLEILKNQISNQKMAEVVEAILADIAEGVSFSAAISQHPNVFPPVYISLVKAAEASGLLDKALLRLADNLEKQQKLKGTIKGALMYPAIVVILMGAVMVIMMIFVIPQLSTLYEGLNVSLPLPTQIVVGLSHLLIIFWPFLIGFIFLFAFLFRKWKKTEVGERIFDSLILKLPVFGVLIQKSILAEVARTLGLLIGSGTLVVESLVQASEITGNIHFKEAMLDVAKRVEKGVTVADALILHSIFPPVLVQLVQVGEQTGKLDETLLKASDYFEEEVNQSVKTLTTAMEPLIMVVLGAGVAFLVISIISPIYKLTSAIQ